MSTVFVNGVFDLLTPAHFNLFLFAARLGGDNGKLYVALDSDKKAKKDKGSNRPIFTFEERRQAILSLQLPLIPNEVYCFNTNEELHSLIEQLKPDIILKSDQWKNNVVGSDLAKVVYFNTIEKYSTSKIVERVLSKHDCRDVMLDRMIVSAREQK